MIIDLAHFVWDLNRLEKLSYIKLPLEVRLQISANELHWESNDNIVLQLSFLAKGFA